MRYRYLDDFRRGISVFAIFSYGIAVLGTPQCPPPQTEARHCSDAEDQHELLRHYFLNWFLTLYCHARNS